MAIMAESAPQLERDVPAVCEAAGGVAVLGAGVEVADDAWLMENPADPLTSGAFAGSRQDGGESEKIGPFNS